MRGLGVGCRSGVAAGDRAVVQIRAVRPADRRQGVASASLWHKTVIVVVVGIRFGDSLSLRVRRLTRHASFQGVRHGIQLSFVAVLIIINVGWHTVKSLSFGLIPIGDRDGDLIFLCYFDLILHHDSVFDDGCHVINESILFKIRFNEGVGVNGRGNLIDFDQRLFSINLMLCLRHRDFQGVRNDLRKQKHDNEEDAGKYLRKIFYFHVTSLVCQGRPSPAERLPPFFLYLRGIYRKSCGFYADCRKNIMRRKKAAPKGGFPD